MEAQGPLEMSAAAQQEGKEVSEEQFLKELYLFMKRRDTPIERIPHLGFKQIDLFVMFKTVNQLGGYQQVTSQQLWKQVYNTLGGNPRSTSAATCTRRHYEKLLLPYECHVKGVVLSAVPPHQPKPFHYVSYSEDKDGMARGAKRKLLAVPLHQPPRHLPPDPHAGLFPLPPLPHLPPLPPLPYPHYFHPGHAVLPPFVPLPAAAMPPRSPAPPLPPGYAPLGRGAEPLETLRSLSEWYKSSSGLATQPLNLSRRPTPPQAPSPAPSSFSPPPPSSKNPKFLNKPSTLYTGLHAAVPRGEESDTSEGRDVSSCPIRVEEAGKRSGGHAHSPSSGSDDPDAAETSWTLSSTQRDASIRPSDGKREREGEGAESEEVNLAPARLAPPPETEGKMEIEIPLSVFNKWLKLCGSPAMLPRAPASHETPGNRKWCNANLFPTDLSAPTTRRGSAEDLRLKNAPRTPPTALTATDHHGNHNLAGLEMAAGGRPDVQEVNKPDSNRLARLWDDVGRAALKVQSHDNLQPGRLGEGAGPMGAGPTGAGPTEAGPTEAEAGPSALLMVNSNALLQLTNEEVLKLKKMISSS